MKGLLIAYYFPPLNSIATHRLHSFAKYLNDGVFSLDVVCPQWKGDLDLDTSGAKIFYTPGRTFDNNFGVEKLSGLRKLKDFIANRILKLNYFRQRYPSTFYKEVVEKIKNIDLAKYDFVITSYGPLDSIHIGNYIKSVNPGIKWIIDYRDYYSLLEYYEMGIFRAFFKKYEQKITQKADAFITVSKTLRNGLEELIDKKGIVIYNGFDDYKIVEDQELKEELQTLKLPVFSYAGSLYKDERDVLPFLNYVKETALDSKFCLIFALINDFDEVYLRKCINKLNLQNVLIKRNLNYNQSLTLQLHSTALLLFANFNGRGNGFLTGKVFEYIAAGKPIIYSGTTNPDYELYSLILDYGLGEAFNKFDYASIKKYKARDYNFFSRKKQAENLKKFINEIIIKH
jgi:hypothetical protein